MLAEGKVFKILFINYYLDHEMLANDRKKA